MGVSAVDERGGEAGAGAVGRKGRGPGDAGSEAGILREVGDDEEDESVSWREGAASTMTSTDQVAGSSYEMRSIDVE